MLSLELCTTVDVPLIFSCPADYVPDWQPRILLGMVEARSVNVKNTHIHTLIPPKEDQRMTRMTGPDCAVVCSFTNRPRVCRVVL